MDLIIVFVNGLLEIEFENLLTFLALKAGRRMSFTLILNKVDLEVIL